jgi:catechol 2,3-dioxygenase-like lactoylglutathione lyase family enzyme
MENGVISFESAVPQFTVPDLVRTGEYYRDVLGFQIVGYWDGEQVTSNPKTPPVFAIVRRDSVEVFFSRADQPEVRSRPTGGPPDAYLRVTGIDALAEELRARGAEILDGPEDRIYGQRELAVMDCNGLILCFGEDTRALEPNSTLDVRKVGTDE